MNSAAIDQVFSVPFRHLWSTNFNGELVASERQNSDSSDSRSIGLARFVGDNSNLILKYLTTDALNEQFSNSSSQWPLVLFGPSGTGKTSLALTIVSNLTDKLSKSLNSNDRRSVPAPKPIFMSALDFDRRFRSALETDSIEDFRKRLVQSAGVVIDDLHQLTNKPAAQNEFLLVLDEMCQKNRPIVVTMDCSLQQSKGLSTQLLSRLAGGLSLPVNPPGPVARLEIVRDLANINRVHLTEDACQLLVERLNVTVPKLDHIFAQIKTALRLERSDSDNERNNDAANLDPIDAAKLTRLFKRTDNDVEQSCQLIAKLVAKEFDLKVANLKSNSRKQSIVMARGIAIYLNRTLLGTSFLKIGSYFGNRDHSTIMHAFRKIEKLNDSSDGKPDAASTKNTISKLRQQLTEQFASQINFV
ncbi:MAG: helix-turn-helix domain-containing protein [Mariniblastus sp.]